MKRRRLSIFFAFTLLVPFSPVRAEQSDPIKELPNRVKKFTLKNGMRILVLERPASKTVSFAMEADRIKNPVLREFYKERSVVMEERRLRIDTNPQGKLWEAFLAAAFMAHPYGRPIVGWESDISHVTRKDAEKFFKQHYDVS